MIQENQPFRQGLLCCPLEPYKSRYSELLHQWERREFSKRFSCEFVEPAKPSAALNIVTGEVLDAVQRPIWALGQVQALLQKGPILGKLWFSDFYHPGLDALAYSRAEFTAYAFCWAQTFDTYDFTRRFYSWMRPWEIMAFSVYKKVFVASSELRDRILCVDPSLEDKVELVGLPFNSNHVYQQIGNEMLPSERDFDMVYSSRWDKEKNPGFFLDLVDACPDLSFAICTGSESLRGSDEKAVLRAKQLQRDGRLSLFENCSKREYYRVLTRSKVQFNCGFQDWVSFTLLEALTFGCIPLYPNHRSFPEALYSESAFLYEPENLSFARSRFTELLDVFSNSVFQTSFGQFRLRVLNHHDNALTRIADIISES